MEISPLSFSTCSGDTAGLATSVPFMTGALAFVALSFFLFSLFFSPFLWPPASCGSSMTWCEMLGLVCSHYKGHHTMFLLTSGGKHCTKTLITAAKEITKHLELSLQYMYPICKHHLERLFHVYVFSYQMDFVANNDC